MIKSIIAHDLNGGIGKDNKLLWHLPKDLAYFREKTLFSNVIVGRTTFNGLPFDGKGFPKRDTLVLTNSSKWESPLLTAESSVYFLGSGSMLEVIEDTINNDDDVWLAGGYQTYKTLEKLVTEWHITEVQSKFEADTFFKPDLTNFVKVGDEIDVSEGDLEAYVQVWKRIP